MKIFLWILACISLFFAGACVDKTGYSKTGIDKQVHSETDRGSEKSGKDMKDPVMNHPELLAGNKGYAIVVSANYMGVWLNGKLVGRLKSGAVPPMGLSPKSSVYELPRLKRRFQREMRLLPLSEWNLLLLVTLSVEAEVVQRILQAAGLAGITKYKIERVPGR